MQPFIRPNVKGATMKRWNRVWGAGLLSLLTLGCVSKSQDSQKILNPIQARDWLVQNPTGQLVDVRNPEEYAAGHIPGSKRLPVQELGGRLGELRKDKPILLYCHSGKRSQTASEFLEKNGFPIPFQIQGGITAWKSKGLPVKTGPK